MVNKNLILLILSQIFGFTAATVTVFLSGIIGSDLSPIKTLSTLPPSIYEVGIAVSTIMFKIETEQHCFYVHVYCLLKNWTAASTIYIALRDSQTNQSRKGRSGGERSRAILKMMSKSASCISIWNWQLHGESNDRLFCPKG